MTRLGQYNYPKPSVIVVDNFYKDPDSIRQLALRQRFNEDLRYHKGKRSENRFLFPWVKEAFEQLLGYRITDWQKYPLNGIFQYCHAQDDMVYHSDKQEYAGAIYLSPEAPLESGTSLWRSKATGLFEYPTEADAQARGMSVQALHDKTYQGFYDGTIWDKVDQIGNRYNRLALWRSTLIHSGGPYFGPDDPEKCRLFQLFFFDIGEPLHANHFPPEISGGPELYGANTDTASAPAQDPGGPDSGRPVPVSVPGPGEYVGGD